VITSIPKIEMPKNEPNLTYAPGSKEKAALKAKLNELCRKKIEIPCIINGRNVRTGKTGLCVIPHDHKHVLGVYHKAGKREVEAAIKAAMAAKKEWAALPWEARAAVFLKAADILAGEYRATLNAATMLGQSKTAFQAEIDSACELIDFFRFNVYFMKTILGQQPESAPGIWNMSEARPLDGFVFAVTPFNFTAIAGNLPTAPAMMGNTCVWKPASSAVYSAHFIMQLLKKAGLPDGVINMIPGQGSVVGDMVLTHQAGGLNPGGCRVNAHDSAPADRAHVGAHDCTLISLTTLVTPGADQAAPNAALRSAHESTLPRSVTVEPLAITSMFLASSCACRANASRIRFTTLAGATFGLSAIALLTPTTPVRLRTALSALWRWYSQSTSPLSVTQPFSTLAWMRSAGTSACQRSPDSTAAAISESLRLWPGSSFTSSSTAIAFTPCTRCTARSIAYFSAYVFR